MHKALEENEKTHCTHRNTFVNGKIVLNGGISERKFPPKPLNIVEEREACAVMV
jgi:hypothetical protein